MWRKGCLRNPLHYVPNNSLQVGKLETLHMNSCKLTTFVSCLVDPCEGIECGK